MGKSSQRIGSKPDAKDEARIGLKVKTDGASKVGKKTEGKPGNPKDTPTALPQGAEQVDEFSGEEAKKRGTEHHLTNQYNFLGPGTEFRARMAGKYVKMMKDAGRKLVGTAPYNKPINKLDACAKKHDTLYAKPNTTAAQVTAADRKFQKCAQKIKVSDGLKQKALSLVSRAGFEGKIALESAGVLRKGSFAVGGAKRRNKRDP
tara:strand:+ start:2168 stop:2779 length:612 start_codon:yes stop_codon:yes gene_type:complete